MDFTGIEQAEGVRFVWNNLPHSRIEVHKNILPVSMLYTPFSNREDPIEIVTSSPLVCSNCGWIASPHSAIDYSTLKYDCSNCSTRSSVSSYHQNLVANGYTIPEFEGKNSTIEYTLEEDEGKIPFLIFVVDTALLETEFQAMQKSLLEVIEHLEGFYFGLITVSSHVYLHDLNSPFPRETIISGRKEYTQEKLLQLLGLKAALRGKCHANRYIQPIEDCKEKVLKILGKLKVSQFEVKKTERAMRASGQALAVAISLVQSFGGIGGRVVSFLGGPCTTGPGKIISEQLLEVYRNHNDIEENSEKILQYQNAKKFYESLLPFANNFGTAVDLFAFCLTQFGLSEMRSLVEKTGGLVVNEEEFKSEIFEKCLSKYIISVTGEQAVYNAQLVVRCSKDLYLSGMLGPSQLVEKSKDFPKDAENCFGESGGNTFRLNSPISSSTYLFFFSLKEVSVGNRQKPCFFQFQTTYTNTKGRSVTRVLTLMREFVTDEKLLLQGFD